VRLQHDDRSGYYSCPKHPELAQKDKHVSSNADCSGCEAEFSAKRAALQAKLTALKQQMKDLQDETEDASAGEPLEDLRASLQQWKLGAIDTTAAQEDAASSIEPDTSNHGSHTGVCSDLAHVRNVLKSETVEIVEPDETVNKSNVIELGLVIVEERADMQVERAIKTQDSAFIITEAAAILSQCYEILSEDVVLPSQGNVVSKTITGSFYLGHLMHLSLASFHHSSLASLTLWILLAHSYHLCRK
jgi:hypothetical protein